MPVHHSLSVAEDTFGNSGAVTGGGSVSADSLSNVVVFSGDGFVSATDWSAKDDIVYRTSVPSRRCVVLEVGSRDF